MCADTSAGPADGRPSGPPLVDICPFQVQGGHVVDPVDPGAAALLSPSASRAAGLLPFARDAEGLQVACLWPLRAVAPTILASLGANVRLARVGPADLQAAQDRAYGPSPWSRPPRFGEVAEAMGKVDGRMLQEALAIQRSQGGRLGAILANSGRMSPRDVAEVVARQSGLPFVDLLHGPRGTAPAAQNIEPSLFDVMPEAFWRTHAAVPLERRAGVLTVAAEDPRDRSLVASLVKATRRPIALVVTGRRDIAAALEVRYSATYTTVSRLDLLRRRPDDSARSLLTGGQWLAVAVLLLLAVAGLWRQASMTLLVLNCAATVAYVALVASRMWLLRKPTQYLPEIRVDDADVAALDSASLPPYTVLVPARREAAVLPLLAQAIAELDYPKDRLDVKLLLEADDEETIRAARELKLPPYVEIVTVPSSEPRTKPKACNYGLHLARGEYVVIYDAEDIPEPDQLKKALLAFARVAPDVVCVQAKLSYYNRGQNLLTRWFTAEYAMWFDLMLPALHESRLPIPLGGTSNHLRVDALRAVGSWDPYNVTEDADLGVRLHKAGYRTVMMDSTTYEEANSDFVNWVRQRSRWVKGYIQTWVVHMRHPLRLWRELGGRGFWGFQLMVGGTPLVYVFNPVYWFLTTLWFMTGWRLIPQIFPSWAYYLGMLNLLLGNFAFTYLTMAAAARRGEWELVKYSVFAPLYWGLMSLAAWKAVIQLVTRPSHWEKTLHGLSDISELTDSQGAGTGRQGLTHGEVAV